MKIFHILYLNNINKYVKQTVNYNLIGSFMQQVCDDMMDLDLSLFQLQAT